MKNFTITKPKPLINGVHFVPLLKFKVMKATAIKILLKNADPIAYGLGMTAKELVKHWANNPKAIPGLIEDYESDYNMMLTDFGEDAKDVIDYKTVIDFLKSLKTSPSV